MRHLDVLDVLIYSLIESIHRNVVHGSCENWWALFGGTCNMDTCIAVGT